MMKIERLKLPFSKIRFEYVGEPHSIEED